jgi:hypothetical protein
MTPTFKWTNWPIGARVRVKGTRLEWLVTDVTRDKHQTPTAITVERRDEAGVHIEQAYAPNQLERVR